MSELRGQTDRKERSVCPGVKKRRNVGGGWKKMGWSVEEGG